MSKKWIRGVVTEVKNGVLVFRVPYRVESYTAPPMDLKLPARDREVLDLLVRGKANKEIASALNMGINTVKFHVTNLLRYFDCGTRGELAFKMQRVKLK
jgi:DNA-binding CsgD family transcriptional regulator